GPDEWKNLQAAWSGTAPRPFHPLRVFALGASLGLALCAVGAAVTSFLRRGLGSNFGAFGYGAAFVAALLANMALLGLAQKQVFGHYVTNLMPFVFVAYAVLGRAALARRGTTLALCLAFVVFAAGGIEATLSVSRRVDARIGLAVHREALAAI